MLASIVAKFKQKKKVKSQDGGETTVYVYSERQVAKRHKEKAERLEKLRKSKDSLDTQVRKDLSSKDEKTRGVALAIALMDATAERVGNEESADDGHVGVTGWTKEHISFKGGKAVIDYTGKSGVKQHKEISDKKLVKALKDACDGSEDCVVGATAEDVNSYLKEFDITAKDIRGLHANESMKENLRKVRKKGPKLPSEKGDREKLLKDEFKKALELTAEEVGHEDSTLRSQYLVPGLEEDFMDDGSVNDSLVKKGTKTPAEREDDALENRVRKAPQKKPPRHDLRNLPKAEDLDQGGLDKGDDGDPDFSRKHQASGFSRYMSTRVVTELPLWSSRSLTNMPKISPNGVKKMTADLERVASAVQDHYAAMGLPQKMAYQFAWSCDYLSDHLERQAGLRRKADFDPKQNFTESENIQNRFDAAEIGMESSGPLMQDDDEPYMGVFTQDEFDQLREVQQTGMFSNAKVAARAMSKLANLMNSKGVKLRLVKAEEKDEDEDEANKTAEEDEDEEKDENPFASKKKASDPYGLFG